MSQVQATGFPWQFPDIVRTNAMLNTQYASCDTADAIRVCILRQYEFDPDYGVFNSNRPSSIESSR
jgi:hypothetical protein